MNSTRTLMLGGLLALAVTVTACGGSSGSSYSPTSPTPTPTPSPTPTPGTGAAVTITITGQNGAASFSPNPGAVTAGQTVAWRNADTTVHDVTADNGAFDTGVIGPGATSTPIMMSAAGLLNYHCSIHPTMTGSLNIAAQPGSGTGY